MPDVGALIDDFLDDAATGETYSRQELRELRGALAHVVTSELGMMEVEAVRGRDVQALADSLRGSGLAASRVSSVVAALRPVYAYAIGREIVRNSPLVGLAPATLQTSSPTDAILALGDHLVVWTVRIMLIALLLTAVGLAVALA